MESIAAKLGSARLLADVEAAEDLVRQSRNLEAVQKLGPFCIKGEKSPLDKPGYIKALTILKVRLCMYESCCRYFWEATP